jgi:YD repeat-containing protein
MSSGGLMQLVAYGAQDVYLTGNPQITFFKVVYKRHTNFSMEINEIPFNSGNNNFYNTGKHSVTISRNGDLITQIYLHIKLNQITGEKTSTGGVGYCRRLGHSIIESVEITIGGSRIDKQYGTWLDIWYELTHTEAMEKGYRKMIGDVPELTDISFGEIVNDVKVFKNEYSLYIPLQFWFNRQNGLALPLIALQYHEVKIDFEFKTALELLCYTENFDTTLIKNITLKELNLLVNYIYLDNYERRKFAQVGHEYLIEQLQYTGSYPVPSSLSTNNNSNTNLVQNVDLNFNHPTKELVWVMKSGNYTEGNKFLGYSGSYDDQEAVDYAVSNLLNHAFIFNCESLYDSSEFQKYTTLVTTTTTSNGTVKTYNISEGFNPIYKGTSYIKIVNTTSVNSKVVSQSIKNIIKCTLTVDSQLDNYLKSGKTANTSIIRYSYDGSGKLLDTTDALSDLTPIFFFNSNVGKIYNTTSTYDYDLLTKIKEININVCLCSTANDAVSDQDITFDNIMFDISCPKHSISIRDISIPVESTNGTWSNFLVKNHFNDIDNIIVHDHCNYGILINGTNNPVNEVVLQFNGHDRFDKREGIYFNYVQPYEHHTRIPVDGINVYSFAINPENFQPSGSANLSRIDTTRLNITYKDTTKSADTTIPSIPVFSTVSKLYVFDVNYNVLRILSGMGGLAYSN